MGVGMAQWSERTVATSVAWVRFVPVALLGGFSPGSLVFLLPQKPASPTSNATKLEDPHGN